MIQTENEKEFQDFLKAGLVKRTDSEEDFMPCKTLYELFSLWAEYPMKEKDFLDLADKVFGHFDRDKYQRICLTRDGFRALLGSKQG